MFVSTRRAAAAAAASARITPVSASPRTAGDADPATFTPSSATSAAVSAICAGGSLARVEGGRAVGGGLRLQHGRVGGELLLGEPQRVDSARSARSSRGVACLVVDPEPRRHLDQRRRERGRDRRRRPAARAPACPRPPSRGTPPVSVHVRSATRGYGSGVVTDEQVESFRRDGFLIIEEGLIPMSTVEVLRERFAAHLRGRLRHRHRARRGELEEGPRPRRRDPPDLQRLARRRPRSPPRC